MSDDEKQKIDGSGSIDGASTEEPMKGKPFMKKKYRKKPQKASVSSPPFKGSVKEIEDHTFVWSEIRTKKWITSREEFIEYASRKYGGDVETSLEEKEEIVISVDKREKPTDTELATWDEFDKDDYRQDNKDYKMAIKQLRLHLSKAYKQLWGQCDPGMQQKIKAQKIDFTEAHRRKSAIKLLAIIEFLCEGGDNSQSWRIQRVMAAKRLNNFRQYEDMSLAKYLQQFEVLVTVAEKAGVDLADEGWINDTLPTTEIVGAKGKDWSVIKPDVQIEVRKEARERHLATIFFMNASEGRYAAYKQECHNAYSKNRSEYPQTVDEAYTAMEAYKFNVNIYQAKGQAPSKQMSHHNMFLTQGATETEEQTNTSKKKGKYQCYNCGRWDKCISTNCQETRREDGSLTRAEYKRHKQGNNNEEETEMVNIDEATVEESYKDELTEDDYNFSYDDFNMNMIGESQPKITIEDLSGKNKHVFNLIMKGKVNPLWILLDSCSTVHIFCDRRFLRNIHNVNQELHLYTNSGKSVIGQMGELPGFGLVWYHAEGIANVLSFHRVSQTKGFKIEYQNWIADEFRVTNPQGVVRQFKPSQKGLYYWDTRNRETSTGTLLVETVQENKENFTHRDVKRAERARALQHNLGHVSDAELMRIAKNNTLLNSPVTPRDVRLMKRILGANVPGLKGKTVRNKKAEIQTLMEPVPQHVREFYQDITLAIDIMKVNKIPFLTTLSKSIHFTTATPLAKMELDKVYNVINDLVKFYRKRRFKVAIIMADGQFDGLRTKLAGMEITLNIVGRDEHVPEIERMHRVIKERSRSTFHNTPFKKLPQRMVTELIRYVLLYINGLPWEKGVSKSLSPLSLVTGLKLDYGLHCQVPFGTYAQVRMETDNTLKERTIGAIATGPNQNLQGGMRFFNLNSGRVIDRSRNDFTLLPMPDEVIARVNQMGKNNPEGLEFLKQNNDVIEDEMDGEETANNEHGEMTDAQSSVEDESDSDDASEGEESVNNTQEPEHEIIFEDDNSSTSEGSHVEVNIAKTGVDEAVGNTGVDTDESGDESEEEDGIRRSRYGREIRNRQDEVYEYHNVINGLIATQYGLRAGLKKFGTNGIKATRKELNQMLRREVFEEIEYGSLTPEDKKNALPILLFLTEKRDGTIKGRACADGRKQKIWTQKADSASPTISIEALFYTLVRDAVEERDVATCDLPGHFLQTKMEGRVILRLFGELADLLVEIDPERWRKHRQLARGKSLIYVKCSKAIYGTVNAALLSYKKLIGHLSGWGFEMNPYDPCCWNQIVNGKQMTVVFHVDDMKLSHVNPDVVTKYIKKLDGVYGKTDPMSITRGKKHEYLGMTIEFIGSKQVQITMYDFIKKMLNEIPKDMNGTKPTAAGEHLFKVDPNGDKLDKETKDVFHHITAKSLYLGKRGRPDVQTSVSFCCTRVQTPDTHDYKKLGHLMKYIHGTAHLPLILGEDGKGTCIYVDGAHGVHPDKKGHGGVMVTEGIGTIYASSTKLKLNTTSSTESEIVAVGEKLPKHIWYRNFRIAQGERSQPDTVVTGGDILYQDNESAMLLENNGRISCGKGTKHIEMKYFYVTDKVHRKEVRIIHCPTEEMIADYFTKPVQGSLFRKFRNTILGVSEDDFEQYKAKYHKTLKEFGLTDNDNGDG